MRTERAVSSILLFLAAFVPNVHGQSKPNVVVILTDDQGWGDLSSSGNTNLSTPRIDSIAEQGARFDRFFVQPVCSPTRAEFLTGRWHPRGGVSGVSTGAERLDLDESTIADAFSAAGYATGCFGKWHNGSQYPYHPRGRGFQEYYGFTSGHWGDYFDAPMDDNGKQVKGKGFMADDLTSRAIDFLARNRKAGKPSFCYLAFNTPHSPMQVPDTYWNRFAGRDLPLKGGRNEQLDHTRAALAMCENLDDNVGRLLDAIDSEGMASDTIVVFFCDNGPNGPRFNGGMKGIKGTTDEGGVRSPLFVRWPGRIAPGTIVRPIAGAIDLLPTLTELAGIARKGEKPLDGTSMAGWLLGRDTEMPRRILFQHWARGTSARDQRFRLDSAGQLFDMIADPGQTTDVSTRFADDAERLKQAVTAWRRDVLGELRLPDARPFPVGYREWPDTILPARDGVPHAGVKRSAPAPNCSFFTRWTALEDSMTWEVEVQKPGRFEAIVHYTCGAADAGSEIALKLGSTEWRGQVDKPHDPPLRGMEHDRSPRGSESYVKDFRPLSLGVLDVAAGRSKLTLQAVRVAGGAVADVRAVELRRLEPER
ncbi:sulfatase-like hydrolase/transferase [bacterium]|nr:sulfatase-like hydrolase/transferase [bacterium]